MFAQWIHDRIERMIDRNEVYFAFDSMEVRTWSPDLFRYFVLYFQE